MKIGLAIYLFRNRFKDGLFVALYLLGVRDQGKKQINFFGS